MIVVWGPLDDPPLAHVLDSLGRREVDVVHIDDTDLDALRYDVSLTDTATGWIEVDQRRIALDDISGMYLRPGASRRGTAVGSAAMLSALAACSPAVVINRPWAGRSNWSKPFQVRQIQAAGLTVPDTVVTTDAGVARQFLERHGRLIYKSVSGVRSIVGAVDASTAARLEQVSTGPVQLQQWIDGTDVRIHVVGQQWFATAITSSAVDYRYAANEGSAVSMAAIEIPVQLGNRLVELTHRMGLVVSGIDLRVTPDGDWCCFEVNPSPGFTYYEENTGQPISAAIADELCGTHTSP